MALWGLASALSALAGAAAASRSRSSSSSSSSGGGGSSYNQHRSYLEQTFPGGSSAYIRSQQQRYQEAVRTGDVGLQERLRADAARVGYSLPEAGGGGTSSPSIPASNGGRGSSPSENVPLRQYFESQGYNVQYNPEGTIWLSKGNQPLYALGSGDYQISQGRAYLPASQASSILNQLASNYTRKQAEAEKIARMADIGDVLSQGGFTSGGDPFSFLPPQTMTMDQALNFAQAMEQLSSRMGGEALNETLAGMLSPQTYQAIQGIQQLQPPPYIQQPVDLTAQLNAVITPYVNELQRISQGVDAETAPIISQAYDQIMGMINSTEQALIQRFNQLGQGVDPATQAALTSLKETVNQQRQNLMEEMSRRGLLQSGIWLEMENRLNQGLLTEQQRLMATRLSDLQNQLNQALMNLGQARIQATSQLGTAQIQAAEAAAQRRQQALSDLLAAAQEAYNQYIQQQQEAQRLAWEREKFYAPWTIGPTPSEMLPYQYPRASDLVPYEYGPTPAQLLPYQYPTANALVPYEYGPTPYQQQQLSLQRSRLAQSAARAAQPSQAEITRQNLAKAQAEIWDMLNSGVPVDKVEALIWKNAGKYTQAGLKASDLVDYAWLSATGYPKSAQ